MINILNLFSWVTWLVILLSIITIFWLIYGGKNEYEFIGVKPLTTKSLFGDIKIPENNAKIYQAPVIYNMKNKPSFDNEKPCKGEEIVAEILEKILASKVQRNIRPGFLKNPETGKKIIEWCNAGSEQVANISIEDLIHAIQQCGSNEELLSLYNSLPVYQEELLSEFTKRRQEIGTNIHNQQKSTQNGTITNTA
jgi:hypothetical protein